MITNEPDITLTGVYNVSQAAKALGISRPTLRRYTNNGMVKPKMRRQSNGGYAIVYEGRELLKLWRAR